MGEHLACPILCVMRLYYAGRAEKMKKQYIETGEIAAVHGVRGEVRVNPWSDSADFVCEF
ncbi:MAG: hypothetical protein RR879_08400, partial [Hydrogenoanaerobacterium sp.]